MCPLSEKFEQFVFAAGSEFMLTIEPMKEIRVCVVVKGRVHMGIFRRKMDVECQIVRHGRIATLTRL